MTGVFRRSAAGDDGDLGEGGEWIDPADRWLEAMDRWGAALERRDHAEVDRLVRQGRAARGAMHTIERLGVAPTPIDPVPMYPMPVDPVRFDPVPMYPMPVDPMEFGGAAG